MSQGYLIDLVAIQGANVTLDHKIHSAASSDLIYLA